MTSTRSFGRVMRVRDVAPGEVFLLLTSKGNGIAMMVGSSATPEATHFSWLTDAPFDGDNRFDLIDTAYYMNNVAVVVDDAVFILSGDLSHLSPYEGRLTSGTIVQDGARSIIQFGNGQRLKAAVDIATGLRAKLSEDGNAIAFSSWSLVRREIEDGRHKDHHLCDWTAAE